MPRPPKVTDNESIAVIRQFIKEKHFITDNFPGPTDGVWVEMSKCVRRLWTPHDCYREVREDRRLILSQARNLEGIVVQEFLDEEVNVSCLNKSEENVNESNEDDWEAPNLENYNLSISEELWKMLRETEQVKYGNQTYSILRRGGWTDVLAEEFYAHAHLPCAYVFKNGKIYESPDSIHHLTVIGRCKAESCNNPIICYIDEKPEKFPITLRIRTRDTFLQSAEHENVQRPTRRLKRLKIGEEAFNEGSGNWRKKKLLNTENKMLAYLHTFHNYLWCENARAISCMKSTVLKWTIKVTLLVRSKI